MKTLVLCIAVGLLVWWATRTYEPIGRVVEITTTNVVEKYETRWTVLTSVVERVNTITVYTTDLMTMTNVVLEHHSAPVQAAPVPAPTLNITPSYAPAQRAAPAPAPVAAPVFQGTRRTTPKYEDPGTNMTGAFRGPRLLKVPR